MAEVASTLAEFQLSEESSILFSLYYLLYDYDLEAVERPVIIRKPFALKESRGDESTAEVGCFYSHKPTICCSFDRANNYM